MTHGGASRRRLLFISPVMPDTGGNGLAMRAGNLVEALGTHWDLHLLVLADLKAAHFRPHSTLSWRRGRSSPTAR